MKILLKNNRGFTFVEVLLSLVVMGIVSISFSILMSVGADNLAWVTSRKEALSQGRFAIHRMSQEMTKLKVMDMLGISETSFSFKDSDNIHTDFHSQTVASELQLYRGEDLLAENLRSFRFVYYDVQGAEIVDYTQSNQVRRIRMELTLKTDETHGDVVLTSEVYPKNFYYSNFQ